jgi:hypothetical protein
LTAESRRGRLRQRIGLPAHDYRGRRLHHRCVAIPPSINGTYTYDNLAYAMPVKLLNRPAGVSLSYHRMLDFRSGEETRMKVRAALGEADLGQGYEFHGGLDAISPSIGMQFGENLAVGATLNFMTGQIKENGNQGITTFGFVVSRGSLLFNQDVSGTSIDLGAQYRVGPRLKVAAVLQPGHTLSFRHGFYSYQPLSTQQSSIPVLFVFERPLLDHKLSVPTMIGRRLLRHDGRTHAPGGRLLASPLVQGHLHAQGLRCLHHLSRFDEPGRQ